MASQALIEKLTGELLAALRHPGPDVRSGAAIALGRLGDPEAVDPIFELLSDPVHRVQESASRALGMLGAPAVGAILALGEDSLPERILDLAARALAQVRDPEAVDLLAAALNYLRPPLQAGAAQALGGIRDPRAVPALVQTTRAADPASRYRAARALLDIGAPEAIHALAALLDVPDPRLRQLAVKGLGRLGGEQAVLSLVTMLSDENERVRWATADALCEVEVEGVEDILLATLNTNSSWVQRTIVEVLGRFDHPEVRRRLNAIIDSEGDLELRLTAAQSLTVLGDPRGERLIIRTLQAPNTRVRRLAAIALGLTGNPRAVDPLLALIQPSAMDPETSQGRAIRRRIVRALAAAGRSRLPLLFDALDTASGFKKSILLEAIESLGPEVVPDLQEALQGPASIEVRRQAARLLGRLGHPGSIEPLADVLRSAVTGPFPWMFFRSLFRDKEAPLRAAAATAMGDLETVDGAALLLSSTRLDPDDEVRRAAARALARKGTPSIIVRYAQLDVAGFIQRGFASALGAAVAGAVAGGVSSAWGVPNAALLVGLVTGLAIGGADGLEARKPPLRGALTGSLTSAGLGLLLHNIAPDWAMSMQAVMLPVVGALTGWGRVPAVQRFGGALGGAILGFLGAATALLLLGTMMP